MHKIELSSPFHSLNDNNSTPHALFVCYFNSKITDEANDIIHVLKYLSYDFPELDEILTQHKDALKSYEYMKLLIDKYEQWLSELKKSETRVKKNKNRASVKLVRYIMHLIYNRAVHDPEKLNHYEPFSPQVYGETSFDLIDQVLKRVKLNENDVFVDLGSGVGNVVLQVAALTKCKKCYGFEKAEWPAFYATKMEKEFRYWMEFFGKTFSEFKLLKGDFLSDEEFVNDDEHKRQITMNEYVKEIINESNFIFVNNYAFGAEVDHQLKLRFCNMNEGAIIVSSKPFCSLNFRINSRNLNDIGTILNINEFEPVNGKVSWTDKPINYYFHKIDRKMLEIYFERLKSKSKEDHEHLSNDCDGLKKKSHKSLVSPNCSSSSSSSCSLSSSMSPSSSSSPCSSLTGSVSSSSQSPNASRRIKKPKKISRNRSISSGRNELQKNRNSRKTKKRKSDSKSLDRESSKTNKKKRVKIARKEKNSLNDLEKKYDETLIKNPSVLLSRSKSLDKEALKTLEKMHCQLKQTEKNLHANEKISYNIKSMTKLSGENLDNRFLKDCKISPKYTKTNNQTYEKTKQRSTSTSAGDESVKSKRTELSEEIMGVVDSYLKKCKKQYLKYLMYMKSAEYEESIKQQIRKETDRKNDLIHQTEQVEKLTNSLLKTNISLLKTRAEELGIQNLKSPKELIEYAKKILTDHQQLVEKINHVQQKVDNLQLKQAFKMNTYQEFKVELLNENSNSNSRLNTLNKLLSTIESKKNKKSKKLLGFVNEDSCVRSEYNGIRSVESNRSADETLTATERGDEEDENNSMISEDDIVTQINNTQLRSLNIKIDPISKKEKPALVASPKLHRDHENDKKNILQSAPAGGFSLENFLSSNDTNKQWRSFKIPKQTNKPCEEVANCEQSSSQVGSPESSTSSTSSLSSIKKIKTNNESISEKSSSTSFNITSAFNSVNKKLSDNEINLEIAAVNFNPGGSRGAQCNSSSSTCRQTSTDSASSPLSTISITETTSSLSNSSNNFTNQQYNESNNQAKQQPTRPYSSASYYHPKKNPLRQYMMENHCDQNKTSVESLLLANHHANNPLGTNVSSSIPKDAYLIHESNKPNDNLEKL